MNSTTRGLNDDEIEAALGAVRFTPPPRATVWAPGVRRGRRSFVRPLLLAAAITVIGVGVVAAQQGMLPIFRTPLVEDCEPDICGPGYAVAATATNDDDSVLAVNLIVASGSELDALEEIAEGFRARHVESRIIVSFFAEGAGQEASAFGLVPSGIDDEFDLPDQHDSWLGTVEFKPGRPASEQRWSSD